MGLRSYLSYWIREKTSRLGSFLRPLRKVSSTAKAKPSTLPPSSWIELGGGCGGAAGGEQVVADDDAVAGSDGVFVEFERVGAVFEGVGDGARFCGEFFRLSNGDETGAESIGERGREDEAAGFDAGDLVNFVAVVVVAKLVDEIVEALLVFQDRGEVVEQDSGLRVIGHFADQLF